MVRFYQGWRGVSWVSALGLCVLTPQAARSLPGETDPLAHRVNVDWPAGMLLGEALGHIHHRTGLDVAAFLPKNKALGTPVQGAFTLGQIMEQLATSVGGDWSLGETGLELVWVRDAPEAVASLGQFRRWWGELRPTTREALLARQVVLLNAQERKALAAFPGKVSLDTSLDDWDDLVGLSLNYDLDLGVSPGGSEGSSVCSPPLRTGSAPGGGMHKERRSTSGRVATCS